MTISASQVKELRQRTGAGMMECKKALQAADGDIEAAVETMRREGLAKADKKAGRVAAEGRIATAQSADGRVAVLVEVNCETDFVAKNDDFIAFGDDIAQLVLEQEPADNDALATLAMGEATVEDKRREMVAALGENISVRRFRRVQAEDGGQLEVYSHGASIGSAVAVSGGEDTLARDLALHVAASAPAYLSVEQVPQDVRDTERETLVAQAKDSGKPDDIIDKMVEGRLRKFLGEITLLGQPFVKDPDVTVEKLLKQSGASVSDYARMEVGEGIEKKEEDFAAEVKAQAGQSV